ENLWIQITLFRAVPRSGQGAESSLYCDSSLLRDGIDGIDGNTRVISVDIPNKQGVRQDDWRDCRVNVRSIEAATGFKFFTTLPSELQEELKKKVDRQ